MIRKANVNDAKAIAYHLFYAMQDVVYEFINSKDERKCLAFLEYFSSSNSNLYSYENCYVWQENNQVIAVANLYDGAKLQTLRTPVESYIRQNFNPDFQIEDETQAGEIYLDTFAVTPSYRGKGIGGKMLRFLIYEVVCCQKKTLGLLVEVKKQHTFQWYQRFGFEKVGEKHLLSIPMYHMQIKG